MDVIAALILSLIQLLSGPSVMLKKNRKSEEIVGFQTGSSTMSRVILKVL